MFTELERALILRALNTERNNLSKWYGLQPNGRKALGYTEDIVFKGPQAATWEEQIAAIFSAEKKLNEMEVIPDAV